MQEINITFNHEGLDYSIAITPEEADWWTSVGDFDIHYCEDYNSISVYKLDNNYIAIHKQKIKPFGV